MTTLGIVQSSYIPWKGYFDLIRRSEIFVLYDCVQYTARDWRNRNLIKTGEGLSWLTIPMKHAPRDARISDMRAAEMDWPGQHWKTIQNFYANAPHFDAYATPIRALFESCTSDNLSDINLHFLSGLCAILNITTPLNSLREPLGNGDRTDNLIAVCEHYNATNYLSGPSAKAYMQPEKFVDANIELQWMDYTYPKYRQCFPGFESGVTILDLIFNTGPDAEKHVKHSL